jgi:DNA-binding NarL/FixJ family response regulator
MLAVNAVSIRMRYKILLVDDHQLVREGIKCVLEQDSGLSVCGEAENGKEAVAKTLALNPDLVLMDLSMPIMGGIEATGLIRQMSPDTKILIVSLHDSAQAAEQAKKAGANAFLCKSRSADDLIDAINMVLEENGDNHSCTETAKTAD